MKPDKAVLDERRRAWKAMGERILTALRKKGMEQAELADKSGIHASSLSFMISGKRGVPTAKLPVVAEALGVTVDYLSGRQALEDAAAHIAEAMTKPHALGEEPDPEQWPPGLAEYLAAHASDPRITPRVRWYLINMRLRAEPWVNFGPTFWNDCVDFWVKYLAKLDKGQR